MMSKREMLASVLQKTGLGCALSSTFGKWHGLLVFNYHRIGQPADSPFDHALWSADEEAFEAQVRFLKKNYDVIGGEDLTSDIVHSRDRHVMITFDDGYRDNYALAYPILKQHNVPGTFFITSGFLDCRMVSWWDEISWMVRNATASEIPPSNWWDTPLSLSPERHAETIKTLLSTYKTLSAVDKSQISERIAVETGAGRCPDTIADEVWMTWDMVREMDQNGMHIGGHTVTHPVLAYWDQEVQRQEIFDSKCRIEAELGHPISTFSYPVGQPDSFAEETKQLLQEAGYRWSFSFYGGFSDLQTVDHFDIPRVAVSPLISSDLFQSTARLPWLFA